jgi:alpha-D-ribose 1-methylphosphonate 5-triphosphate synthase subunit PhnH
MSSYRTIDEHAAFRAGLEALARPGTPYLVAGAGDDATDVADLVVTAVWEPELGPEIVAGQPAVGVLADLPRGDEESPEAGATVLVVVGPDDPQTDAVLTGPGVDGELKVTLPLSAAALAERSEACAVWPCGIDLLLVGPGRQVLGLPRTTCVRVGA